LTQIWEDDIDVFFDESDLAETCTYVDPSGGSHTITVIFDIDGIDLAFGASTFASLGPTALCKSSDVPTVDNKAKLTIRGKTYFAVESTPNSSGITMVKLSEDAP
jgi:hypothetical protein